MKGFKLRSYPITVDAHDRTCLQVLTSLRHSKYQDEPVVILSLLEQNKQKHVEEIAALRISLCSTDLSL